MFSPCRRPDDALYDHVALPITGALRSFRWPAKVRQLNLSSFDVLHSHGDNHLRSRHSVPPVVLTMHGSCLAESLHIRGVKERVRMLLLGVAEVIGSLRAMHTVAVSDNTRSWYPWIKTVIPNSVDMGHFHPGPKEDRPTILFVGTFLQRKRGRLLWRAFVDQISTAVPDAQLWMVCSDAPPAPRIEVLGRLDEDELAARYRRAWVFCLPSSYEGFGIPYIEAMSSGTAVVATPNPGSKEVLGRGSGLLVPPKDLGAEIAALLNDDSRRHTLEAAGLRRALEFEEGKVLSLYEEVFQKAIESRPAPRARERR